MDLHYLKIFYEVAKERSFTKAGENLFINQSAVSIQIKKLEGELNAPLFNREAKQIQLTYAGERLFLLAKDIFEKVSRAEIEIERVIKNHHSKIVVGATHMVGEPLLPKLLREFKSENAYLEFEVHVMEREEALKTLLKGNIDVLLMGEYRIFDKSITIKPLANYPFVLIAKEKLEDMRLLQSRVLIGRDDSFLQDNCRSLVEKKYHIHIENQMVVKGSIETVKNLVKEGMGFAILPFHCVAREILAGEFLTVLDIPEYQAGYQAVYCNESENRKEIHQFLNFLERFSVN